jgi:hypothetical protein
MLLEAARKICRIEIFSRVGVKTSRVVVFVVVVAAVAVAGLDRRGRR